MSTGSEMLELSAAIIDAWSTPGGPSPGAPDGPTNRITNKLTEVASGVSVVESFSNVVSLRTDEGLLTFDASSAFTGRGTTAALRQWADDPVHTLVYTHGHVDHVGGSGHLLADGRERGHAPPRVVGHHKVTERFARYRRTDGWNIAINARQFGPDFARPSAEGSGEPTRSFRFLPDDVAAPTDTYQNRLDMSVGGLEVSLRHARGETDDHTWAWIPSARAIASGDLFIWVFPNAGNPQKVQRYPGDWARALREMIALEPELLLPAHGLAVEGKERVALVLEDLAVALERLVEDVLSAMNQGATLDEIVHSVRVDADLLRRPWLRPIYDEPEFVVRNVWRLFGGWWDGDPAKLKPPPASVLAAELADLAGGPGRLVERASELSEAGEHRLACELVEMAVCASEDPAHWRSRSSIYRARAATELSLMAQGVFTEAARAGDVRADELEG